MTERNSRCGGCSLCCELLFVPEINKPMFSQCKYCDTGCIIYKERPVSCQEFRCAWHKASNATDKLRPDHCGVLFEKLKTINVYLAIVNPATPFAWQSETVQKALFEFIKSNAAIFVVSKQEKHLLLPEGRSKDQVIEEINSILPMYFHKEAPGGLARLYD